MTQLRVGKGCSGSVGTRALDSVVILLVIETVGVRVSVVHATKVCGTSYFNRVVRRRLAAIVVVEVTVGRAAVQGATTGVGAAQHSVREGVGGGGCVALRTTRA
jgi:hypothetical protein